MNTRVFKLAFISYSIILVLASCDSEQKPSFFRDSDFNSDWSFHLGELDSAALTDIDDADWMPVHLPHDWSIVDYAIQDSLHQGPFFKNLPEGQAVGYLRDGTAWYRKEYLSPEDLNGKSVILGFDGVQTQTELWLNGELIGENVYGYTPFEFDITAALKDPGEINVIAVKTVNPGQNSRWFAGAGIYREVSISVLNPVSISPWGVFISTPTVSPEKAEVRVEVTTSNKTALPAELSFELRAISPGGQKTTINSQSLTAGPKSSTVLHASGHMENPALWSPELPNLYKAEVVLLANGEEVDRYSLQFGVRSIEYSVEDGFLLNGQEILMKGACMHHDNGLLGATAFREAEFRRVRIMKDNGYNAIRTSHNPPSKHFLDACDQYGMLVIDESFDHWLEAKKPRDYSNYFKEWHVKDIQAMVKRDRNHPSVVMWSFGNEVKERADPEGIKTGLDLIDAIREVDETRPVTQAICGFWDNPGKEWSYSEGAFSIVDIGGYNYQFLNYEADHKLYPDRLMYGSESVPQHAWENWEMVKRHKYVLGDFVWTGMDYMGESGIGHTRLVSEDTEGPNMLKPWPWYIAWCGDIDILGNKKPQSYYRDILWGESKLEMMVVKPVPEGKKSELSYWGWYNELPSWNWEGEEGLPIKVRVYSAYPEVTLELNGERVGRRTLDSLDRYVAEFELTYAPGELKAMGFQDGEERESITLNTTGEPVRLHLDPEVQVISPDKNSLVFIKVTSQDSEGRRVLENDRVLDVKVRGPADLLAAGNAAPQHQGSFTDETFRLFRGQGMIIIRSTGEAGDVGVDVSAGNLQPASISIGAN
jgi:beta-galactosidase